MSEPATEAAANPSVTVVPTSGTAATNLTVTDNTATGTTGKPPKPPTPPTTTTDPDPEPDEPFDKDRAMHTIQKQRDEVKALKARAKEAEDKAAKFDQLEAEKLSEQEKLAKRAEEAEQKVAQAQQKLRQANLIAELSKPEHGIVNASAAAKLIEGVEFTDDDAPSNLDTLLPDFLESNAFLRGEVKAAAPPKVDGGAGRTTGPTPALTAEELEAARNAGMTPDRYAALKDVENVDEFQKLQQQAVAAQ